MVCHGSVLGWSQRLNLQHLCPGHCELKSCVAGVDLTIWRISVWIWTSDVSAANSAISGHLVSFKLWNKFTMTMIETDWKCVFDFCFMSSIFSVCCDAPATAPVLRAPSQSQRCVRWWQWTPHLPAAAAAPPPETTQNKETRRNKKKQEERTETHYEERKGISTEKRQERWHKAFDRWEEMRNRKRKNLALDEITKKEKWNKKHCNRRAAKELG